MKKNIEWDAIIVLAVIIGGFTLEAMGKNGNIVALIGASVGYFFGKTSPDTTDSGGNHGETVKV